MEDVINLYSRDGSTNSYLKRLKKIDGDGESKTYVLKNGDPSLRMGYFGNKKYLELPDRSVMVEGSMLREAEAYIESIGFDFSLGVIITFK